MADVYLPVSLSSSLQLQRDTLTAYPFFRQGWTWSEALSRAADIWNGHGRRNIALHCQVQREVSLKQLANKLHQLDQFLICQEWWVLKRLHFIWRQGFSLGFPRSSSQLFLSALSNSKRTAGGHGTPEINESNVGQMTIYSQKRAVSNSAWKAKRNGDF